MSDANFNIDQVHDKTIANINKILAGSALKVVVLAKANLLRNKHRVTGQLYKSVTCTKTGLKIEFGTNVTYASDIETGIVTQRPNLTDIQEWLKNKVRLGHIPLNSWAKNAGAGNQDINKVLLRLSYKITERIQETGKIKNWNPFMLPSWEETLKETKPKLDQAVVQ